ncbi:hypothetical protein FDP41_004476 [Naegleria fowleri]|uniref:Amidohydrolase-related domain-containing protein n=1 Tax=Naegleria fowleri TaxID=5763 RepID=A0A6A5BI16_NAEFO|nr:uncharacterized protein FDP41_004476 [Naegleria fowleri]KAF0976577.1 hypothetical protein FDP41_004476 [Naegleria fowleri]
MPQTTSTTSTTTNGEGSRRRRTSPLKSILKIPLFILVIAMLLRVYFKLERTREKIDTPITRTLIYNATIVNENQQFLGHVLIEGENIKKIYKKKMNLTKFQQDSSTRIIDATGLYLLPGVIDDQVHFREPGLTHKATIYSESKAAVAGGVTSFIEQPNTNPQTTTQELLEQKFNIARNTSLANFSFMLGGTLTNLQEILKTNGRNVAGIKLFLGSSTGNMLVDDPKVLDEIFSKTKVLIAAHCEDEKTIRENSKIYREKYGEDVPIRCHPEIRSGDACFLSSSFAVNLAKKHNTRLHIFHISTERETHLFDNKTPLKEKRITSEVCIHHLWFSDKDYETKGAFIKWNPAVKTEADREGLWKALLDDRLDVIATDHAPHTIEEKTSSYFKAASGGPLVQHSLVAMLQFYHQGKISLEKIVEKMCHNPAIVFQIEKRGYIRENYKADLVLVNLNKPWTVDKSNILYKCGWSPFEGVEFKSKVEKTFVNGVLVFDNGVFDESIKGQRLLFEREGLE